LRRFDMSLERFKNGPLYLRRWTLALLAVVSLLAAPCAEAVLVGTVPTPPGATVTPGTVPPGTDPGTLIASIVQPFALVTGTATGEIRVAVFREAVGTLDFYYQVANDASSINAIARVTAISFVGFETNTGYRTDGSTLPALTGGAFTDGTELPITADRNPGGGTVGFSFNPPDDAKIGPGETSFVLVISTNATQHLPGFVSVIDGGTDTKPAFGPADVRQPAAIPEPTTLLLLGSGLVAIAVGRRVRGR
jgi:hypothetical protein